MTVAVVAGLAVSVGVIVDRMVAVGEGCTGWPVATAEAEFAPLDAAGRLESVVESRLFSWTGESCKACAQAFKAKTDTRLTPPIMPRNSRRRNRLAPLDDARWRWVMDGWANKLFATVTIQRQCSPIFTTVATSVKMDAASNTVRVTVPEDQLSLAIGKRGQNARLASKLTGWKIDINRAEKVEGTEELSFEERVKKATETLAAVAGIGPETAATLVQNGFLTLEGILAAEAADLAAIEGLDAARAEEILEIARKQCGV